MLVTLPGSNGDIAINISDYWADQNGIGIKGWVSAKIGPPDDLEFICDVAVVPITSWHARDDIAEKAPESFLDQAWGFWCYIQTTSTPSLTIRRRRGKARDARTVSLKQHPAKIKEVHWADTGVLFEEFREKVVRSSGKVLELGSRQVVPGGQSKRSLFPGCSYTGFDYYRDPNTDVVGDAHELSKFFRSDFDAVFSLAVLEHLAMWQPKSTRF